ncbi:MAG: hypothetical protein ACM30E_06980 [Nitrososphaerales archaeon]
MWDLVIKQNSNMMLAQGRGIFRFHTFGDEAFWGDTLQLHKAIEGEKFGAYRPSTVLEGKALGCDGVSAHPGAFLINRIGETGSLLPPRKIVRLPLGPRHKPLQNQSLRRNGACAPKCTSERRC